MAEREEMFRHEWGHEKDMTANLKGPLLVKCRIICASEKIITVIINIRY